MKTKWWAVGLVLFVTLLTSSAQILYKLGVNNFSSGFNILALISNFQLLGGLFLYGIGAGLLILALRGGDLSVLYPLVALSYVWVGILSMIFLSEQMNFFKWSGIAIIIIGMFFIGKGSQDGA